MPENVRERLENYRDEKGKVKIPLRASYELLEALDDEIGKAWAKPELRDALSARNNSITAHGLEPVTEEVARKLKEAVEPIVKRLVPELDSLFQEAPVPSTVTTNIAEFELRRSCGCTNSGDFWLRGSAPWSGHLWGFGYVR